MSVVPALSMSYDTTVDAEHPAARLSTDGQPARLPPTGRTPSLEKYLSDKPAQHLEEEKENSCGPFEDLAHVFDEDVAKSCRKDLGKKPKANGPAEISAGIARLTKLRGVSQREWS